MLNNFQNNYIGFMTIVKRELLRIFRIWPQTLLPPIITTTLYFVIFGNLIGDRVGSVHGVPYVQYIFPGLIMMAVITNSYGNVVSSFFGAKFQKNIEEMLVSPLPNSIILCGFLSGGILRGLITGSLVTVVALFFTKISLHNVGYALITMIFTAILFSLAGFLNAVFANKFDDISIIPTFILTPLIYLGGVFYSISFLDSFWQQITKLNPIFYMINAFRYGLIGISDVSVTIAIIAIMCFIFLSYTLCLWLLKKGIGIKS